MLIPLPTSSCLIADAALLTLASLVSIWKHSALAHFVLAQFCQICGNLWGFVLGHSLNRLLDAHLCAKECDGWASPCIAAENWALASSCHSSLLEDPMNLMQLIGGSQAWQQLCTSTCCWCHPWCDLLVPWYVTVLSAMPVHWHHPGNGISAAATKHFHKFFSRQGWKCILWSIQFHFACACGVLPSKNWIEIWKKFEQQIFAVHNLKLRYYFYLKVAFLKAVVEEAYFYALTLVIIIFLIFFTFQKWVMFGLVLEVIAVIYHKYHWA